MALSCRGLPFSESPIVARLAADRCSRGALDGAVPNSHLDRPRTPRWSPYLRRLPLHSRERAPTQASGSCVSRPCPPESGPSASDLRGPDDRIVSSKCDVRVFHKGNFPSSRFLLEARPRAPTMRRSAPARTCVGLGRGCRGRDCSRFMRDFYMVMRTAAAAWFQPSPELIMTTRSPRLILPSSIASSNAIGMQAEPV